MFLKSPPAGGLFSSDLAENRKCFEQPHAHLVYAAGEEGQPRQHQQRTHHLLDPVEIAAKARQESGKRFDRQGRDNERNSESDRIDGKQASAARSEERRVGKECRSRWW